MSIAETILSTALSVVSDWNHGVREGTLEDLRRTPHAVRYPDGSLAVADVVTGTDPKELRTLVFSLIRRIRPALGDPTANPPRDITVFPIDGVSCAVAFLDGHPVALRTWYEYARQGFLLSIDYHRSR